MPDLGEISTILFNGSDNGEVRDFEANQTTIIYGVALTDSADGVVTVQIDEAAYDVDDIDEVEDEPLEVDLDIDDDSLDSLEEADDEDEFEEEDVEVISWEDDDDDAVEEDDN